MPLRNRLMVLMVLALFCGLCIGCTTGARTRMMVDSMQPMMENMNKAFNKCDDVELVRKAMPANLLQIAGFIEVSPENPHLLLTASEGYGSYALLFLMDSDPARAARFLKKGRDYALRILNQNETFATGLKGNIEQFKATLKTLTPEDAPALYFAASNWFFYLSIISKTQPETLAELPKVEAMLTRLVELDQTFRYGAVHAVLGCYYAVRSQNNGGNPEASLYHFKKAIQISNGKLLLWHLYFAEYYAVRIKDKSLFTQTLDEIAAAPDDLLPDRMLLNQAAKRNAEQLRSKIGVLFQGES